MCGNLSAIVEASGEGESIAKWLGLTDLTRTLWHLRQLRPLSKAFGTRNTRHIASAFERLCTAGFVRNVVGDVHYLYPAACLCCSATALRSWPAARPP